jgi:hypothetical protein
MGSTVADSTQEPTDPSVEQSRGAETAVVLVVHCRRCDTKLSKDLEADLRIVIDVRSLSTLAEPGTDTSPPPDTPVSVSAQAHLKVKRAVRKQDGFEPLGNDLV